MGHFLGGWAWYPSGNYALAQLLGGPQLSHKLYTHIFSQQFKIYFLSLSPKKRPKGTLYMPDNPLQQEGKKYLFFFFSGNGYKVIILHL